MNSRNIFYLLLLCFLSCKKDNSTPEVTPNIKFAPEGLAYVSLDNKYFIYKDSASGELDSIRVAKSLLENIYSPGRQYSDLFKQM